MKKNKQKKQTKSKKKVNLDEIPIILPSKPPVRTYTKISEDINKDWTLKKG